MISVICRIGGHQAGESELWNAGYYFGTCRRCSRALIRSRGEWQAVPKGHRIVWKEGFHRHSVATDYRSNLPAIYRQPQLPAPFCAP